MSMIHVNRNRQNLGQFSPEEVATGLSTGRFQPTDLAWRDGMEAWQPLSNFTDLPVVEAEAPPEPTLAPGAEQLAPTPPAIPQPAWERAESLGYVRAFFETIKQVVTAPAKTFRELPSTGPLTRPLSFCMLIGIIGSMFSVFAAHLWAIVLPKELLIPGYESMTWEIFLRQMLITAPLTVAGWVIVPFVFSGVYFLVAKLITKRPVTFEPIFRAYCYTGGCLALLNFIPLPPILSIMLVFVAIAFLVSMSYQVIAIQNALGVSILEAACIVLIPIILICCSCAAMVGLFSAAIGANPGLQNLGR